jgi:hypothetical protein
MENFHTYSEIECLQSIARDLSALVYILNGLVNDDKQAIQMVDVERVKVL